MVLRRAHTTDAVENNFMCSTYKKKGKEHCTAHQVGENQLAEILLDDLRRVTPFARQNQVAFAKHITQKNGAEIRREITQTERELEGLKRRNTELTALFKRLYEDNVLGKIPNVSAFLEKAKQYTKLDTLTAEILNLFIERVEVGEREERYSRTASQAIGIYYRDIGLLDDFAETDAATEQAPTPQEVA